MGDDADILKRLADAERERDRWRSLVENAPDFVCLVDRQGRIEFVNRVVPGADPGMLIGYPWSAFVADEDAARAEAALASVFATGKTVTLEVAGVTPLGQRGWYSCVVGPVVRDGVVVNAVGVAREITDRRQTEAQLLAADRLASVGTLAAGMAHEINNPLAAVITNVEVARAAAAALPGSSSVVVPALDDAAEAAERLRRIVADLSVFARAGEERTKPVDLTRVLASTARIAANEIRHRARLVTTFGPVPLVEGNEARLSQVFLNLLVNAAHAIEPGHHADNEIRVVLRNTPDGRVAVDVTDTGSGIPPAVRARLFTPFFTTKPIGVGTGLGLSIGQRIVGGYGGEIRVESEVGRGSTFTVLHRPAPAPAPAPVPPPSARGPRRRGRVLVVDDERPVADGLGRLLSLVHDVVVETDAERAFDRIKAGERFDVILCDLMMPRRTGMDLHADIAARDPAQAARMVFVTGGAFTQAAREFLDRVPNTRLDKPFDNERLLDEIQRRLR